MARYIDADALKVLICKHVYPVQDVFNSRDYGMFWTGGIEKAIDEMPTADVQEVVHGRWIETDSHEPCWFKCDQCGRLSDIKEIYCPTCGASMVNTTCGEDMRGEE